MALSATALARVQGARDAAQVGDGRLVVGLLDADGPAVVVVVRHRAERRRVHVDARRGARARGPRRRARPRPAGRRPHRSARCAAAGADRRGAPRRGRPPPPRARRRSRRGRAPPRAVPASTPRPTPPRGRRRRGAPAGGPSGSWWAWGRHSSSLAARPAAMSARSSPLRGADLATGGAARPEIAIALMSKVLQGVEAGADGWSATRTAAEEEGRASASR